MKRSELDVLNEAVAHLDLIRHHMSQITMDEVTVADAVNLRLASAIEALSSLSDSRRTQLFGSDWALIWATRNRIAHGYAFIDGDLIRSTVQHDLPEFDRIVRQAQMDALLAQ